MKYRPKRLLVIAGPSGCGKSWFIDNIIKCNNPTADVMRLRKELEAGRIVIGNHIKISKLEAFYKSSNGLSSCLKKGGFVHFDFMSRRQELRREILRDLVGAAERVIVLNLLASFDRWIEVQSARSLDLGVVTLPSQATCMSCIRKILSWLRGIFDLRRKNGLDTWQG